MNYAHADEKGISVFNVLHVSEDAEKEVALWFSIDEIHSYKTAGEEHLI